MGEKNCERECTCKSSLGHYLVVAGGVLRVCSVVAGLTLATTDSAELSPHIVATRESLDKIVDAISVVTDKLQD